MNQDPLTPETRQVLIDVMNLLREGDLTHAKLRYRYDAKRIVFDVPDNRRLFNMSYYRAIVYGSDMEKCSTVGCIGGWMAAIAANGRDAKLTGDEGQPARYVGKTREEEIILYRLFQPGLISLRCPYNNITPAMAADAIENVLNEPHRGPRWDDVVSKHTSKENTSADTDNP